MTYFATTEQPELFFFFFSYTHWLPTISELRRTMKIQICQSNFRRRSRATIHSRQFCVTQIPEPNKKVLDFFFLPFVLPVTTRTCGINPIFRRRQRRTNKTIVPMATSRNVKYATWTSTFARETDVLRHDARKSFGRFFRDAWTRPNSFTKDVR